MDRQGRRLSFVPSDETGGDRLALELVEPGRCVRFFEEQPIVLTTDNELVRLKADGSRGASIRVKNDPRAFAVTPSGSAIVVYGRHGVAEHGVLLERLGDNPLAWTDAPLVDATAVTCDPGGVWVAGTGRDQPLSRVVYMRPVPNGYEPIHTVALPRPARALAVGPDGALYVVLEPGESLVRVERGRPAAPKRVAAPVRDLVRVGGSLWGCGPRGVVALDAFLPPPAEPSAFTPPPCTS